MEKNIKFLVDKIFKGKDLLKEDIEALISNDLYDVLYGANKIREKYNGKEVDACAIVNAKSGLCSEDCKFCAQSSFYNTNVENYSILSEETLALKAEQGKDIGAQRFGIVTSGNKVTEKDIDIISGSIGRFKDKISPCASLGKLGEKEIKKLKKAGLKRYHHNLETSEKFFPQICTTHSYAERLATIRLVKENGFEVCSGGLFGLGEDWNDRMELAFTLRELKVDSVPLNFLFPVENTPLSQQKALEPWEILLIVAMFRYILPSRDIRVCGGRESNLRDLQSWIFYAGANGLLIGNYLTTKGREPKDDLQMIKDLGFSLNKER